MRAFHNPAQNSSFAAPTTNNCARNSVKDAEQQLLELQKADPENAQLAFQLAELALQQKIHE